VKGFLERKVDCARRTLGLEKRASAQAELMEEESKALLPNGRRGSHRADAVNPSDTSYGDLANTAPVDRPASNPVHETS